MTNCIDGRVLVKKLRKRPAATMRDPQLRTLYGDLSVKRLPISLFINEYNHKMNGVDRADQLRASYYKARKVFKIWRSLWDYLFFTNICNMGLILSKLSPLWQSKTSDHAKFRQKLATSLMARYQRTKDRKEYVRNIRRTQLCNFISVSKDGYQKKLVRLSGKDAKMCKIC